MRNVSNRWRNFLLVGFAMGLLLVSGCSYSASHSSEASFGVDANGKVETSASSSVYTERVENGKTVNQSASVAVGTGTAAKSKAGLSYTAEDADLRKGETEIDGYFTNNGSEPFKIHRVKISFDVYDENKKMIWSDESVIENLNIVVKPGGATETADFIIANPNAPAWTGAFNLEYRMECDS